MSDRRYKLRATTNGRSVVVEFHYCIPGHRKPTFEEMQHFSETDKALLNTVAGYHRYVIKINDTFGILPMDGSYNVAIIP